MSKPCPRCTEPLIEKKDGTCHCRNGCEIYTAVPTGEKYRDAAGSVTVDKTTISFGGTNNLRRVPTCRE